MIQIQSETDFIHFFISASYYELRYTNNSAIFMNETAWIQASLVQDMNIVNGSLIPVEAGRTMEVLIDANKLELESMTNYFAIKAFDYFNQESTVSNVVEVQFDLKPSRIRTLKATLWQDGHTFEITFTATGEDMMNGTGKTN